MTSIGEDAFFECHNIKDLYCYAEEVPKTSKRAFTNSNIEQATLHVPASALEQYKSKAPWSRFGTIVALTDEDAIAEVKSEKLKVNNEEAIYNLAGQKIVNGQWSNGQMSSGINIIRMSDGTTRKVLVK